MGYLQYRQAEERLDRLERCLAERARVDAGSLTQEEWQQAVEIAAGHLVLALHDALHSAVDPRLDIEGLVVRAHDLCARIHWPILSSRSSNGSDWIADWLRLWSDANPAREEMLLLAMEWHDRVPVDGVPLLTSDEEYRNAQAQRLVDLARRMPDPCAINEAVRAGGRAFDPSFLQLVVEAYVASGGNDRRLWPAAEAALDELAVVACSTDPLRTQYYSAGFSLADRAIYALIELAGIPELTGWAVARLPHHRMDRHQVDKLQTLIADRADLFDESLVDESEHQRSLAAELTLLHVLAARGVQERPPLL